MPQRPPFGTPEEVANRDGHTDLAAWLVASRGWTPLAHLESLTAARALSLLRSGASLHEGEPTPLQRAAGGEGEAAALIRRAAAPWSPASHSLFPAAAREYAVTVMRIGYQSRSLRPTAPRRARTGARCPTCGASTCCRTRWRAEAERPSEDASATAVAGTVPP